VSRALGHEMGYSGASDVMDEIAALTPEFAGVSFERIGVRGLQWPVAPDGSDSEILYSERFEQPGGRGRFAALPFKPPGDAADEEFPLILVTGRILEHYNAGTMTRRTRNVDLLPAETLQIHPDDAGRLGVVDGDRVEVRSRRAALTLPAALSSRVAPGEVFMSFHFPDVPANALTSSAVDEVTSCPEYKVTAVRLRAARWGARC
jgi:formate dehydrogenase major subunit